jgi:dUTPase
MCSLIDLRDLNDSIQNAVLYLYVDSTNDELIEHYKTSIEKHNHHVLTDPYPNAGFDISCPKDITLKGGDIQSVFIDFRIKGEMRVFDSITNQWKTTGYYVFPRSSISKTSLMLANHTGIIDSGYRGFLIGAFRNLHSEDDCDISKYTRMLQICSPDMRPILVKIVDEMFFIQTARGEGGFGSTNV